MAWIGVQGPSDCSRNPCREQGADGDGRMRMGVGSVSVQRQGTGNGWRGWNILPGCLHWQEVDWG
jgi:hypothetical protein